MATVPAHEIPKNVETIKIWHLTAPVDVATSHRLPKFMWISKNWQDVICENRAKIANKPNKRYIYCTGESL